MFTSRFKLRLLLIAFFVIIFVLPTLQVTSLPIQGSPGPVSEITDLSLGNSHTQSLNFDSIGLKGLRIHIDGSGVLTASFNFHRFVSLLPKLERVWIPINSFYPYSDLDRIFFARSLLLYDVLGGDWAKEIAFGEIVWRQKVKIWLSFKNDIRLKAGLIPQLQDHVYVDGASLPCRSMSVEDAQAKNDSSVTLQRSYIDRGNQRGYDLLEDIVKNSAKKGIKVIFFTPPYMKIYFKDPRFDEFRPEFTQKLSSLVGKYDNATYLDFHDLFYDNYRNYFYDSNHLNCHGAEAFTKVLYDTLDLGKNSDLRKL